MTATVTATDLLREGAEELRRAGVAEARLDAEVLLAAALGCSRLDLLARDMQPTAAEAARYTAWLARRAGGEPVAYIVGEKEFYGVPIAVGPGVLVPRPESELLVDLAVETLAGGGLAADVGTGSGCLAVAIALQAPAARVWATDVSAAALATARANVDGHGLTDRVTLLEGDLAAPLAAAGLGGRLDLVVANLPYVTTAECRALPRDVREHEPPEALDGGPDGLAFLGPLVGAAPDLLAPGGRLGLEVALGQAPAVRGLLEADGRYGAVETRSDLAGIERMVSAVRR